MLDALLTEARYRWALDPAAGIQVIATEHLVGTPLEPSRPAILVPLASLRGPTIFVAAAGAGDDRSSGGGRAGGGPDGRGRPGAPGAPGLVGPVGLPGRDGPGGSDPRQLLARLYPADHPVGLFRRPEETTIAALLEEDLAGPLYLAPVAPELSTGSWAMPWIASRLRRPDGCPWDREQTHESLRKHLLEEAYEVYDALGAGATTELAGELGDLFLQVVLHAQLAAEAGVFDLADVQAGIARKIVRRHPHVFGSAEVHTTADVNRQWERIKAAERDAAASERAAAVADESGVEAPKSALDGISRSMPALAASQEMQERASALGYDWPTIDGIIEKVHEELAELAAAESIADRREEIGDLLLVLVNLARRHDVEAEAALRLANDKFRRRFAWIERAVAARGVALRDLDFDALDALWDQAKVAERAASTAPAPASTSPTPTPTAPATSTPATPGSAPAEPSDPRTTPRS